MEEEWSVAATEGRLRPDINHPFPLPEDKFILVLSNKTKLIESFGDLERGIESAVF
jgi:hypothetical protein